MSEVKTKVGWFSIEQARLKTKLARQTNGVSSGSTFWTTPEGGEVEVTEVISSGEPSSWGDAVCRGEVVAYSRPGHPYREQLEVIEIAGVGFAARMGKFWPLLKGQP